tara:strand:+ start:1309 stop:1881 length:573 start_codon:yes stop_codon:yes gene_type:complete
MKLSKTKLQELIQEVLADALDEANPYSQDISQRTGSPKSVRPTSPTRKSVVEPISKATGAERRKGLASITQQEVELMDVLTKLEKEISASGNQVPAMALDYAKRALAMVQKLGSQKSGGTPTAGTGTNGQKRAMKSDKMAATLPRPQKSAAPVAHSGGRKAGSTWGKAAAQEAIVRALGKILEEGRKRKG